MGPGGLLRGAGRVGHDGAIGRHDDESVCHGGDDDDGAEVNPVTIPGQSQYDQRTGRPLSVWCIGLGAGVGQSVWRMRRRGAARCLRLRGWGGGGGEEGLLLLVAACGLGS